MHLYSCTIDDIINLDTSLQEKIIMPLKFKINILNALKDAGYNTNKIRKENLLAQSTLQKLRTGGQLSWENISTICQLLNCQPGDILEYADEAAIAVSQEKK